MAAKNSVRRPGLGSPTSPTDPSPPLSAPQFPPSISSSTPVLATTIDLPPGYSIVCGRFATLGSENAHHDIEHARRQLLQRNSGRELLQSILPCVQITKLEASLWVFGVETGDDVDSVADILQSLSFAGLTCMFCVYYYSFISYGLK